MLKEYMGSEQAFVIAEVGQNHQGSVEEALRYIEVFSSMGADAVKFQTRNNKVLFDSIAYEKPYNSDNAFAETYGAHREILELPIAALPDLKAGCHANGVAFMSTPFDEPSLEVLLSVGVDLLKLASFDLGNLPFLKLVAESGLPVVMSCGGGDLEAISASVETLVDNGCVDLAILHCISEYPCSFDKLALGKIETLASEFPGHGIGLSDHFNGILSGPLGFVAGARIFEKHVTFDRSKKGTDHSFALEPDGFRKFCRDIRRAPIMLGSPVKTDLGDEPVFKKLGKSLCFSKSITAGSIVSIDDLSSKIYADHGISVKRSKDFIGKTVSRSVSAGEKCTVEDFKNLAETDEKT